MADTLFHEMRRALHGCECVLTEIERDHPEWFKSHDRKVLANARAALTRARGEG